ncbi:hypothetical protein [Paraburkholderia saeva]|uniref:Uncharacterized protein n=1 Tax=Paraburkholderia saeva TaxID=2777537 RepID=A0A9N8RRJ9_9BURK|nr:hypothetical protein [Paraburkholderia saeva]CAG4886768.1 hypothetical protein LMG31841_00258 [Paraburkholderia saeva]CAG4925383.1 hypothetical protein R52603_05364 [Paraburkholderia saeva]
MKAQTRLRLTGEFSLLGFALLATEAMAWVLSIVVNATYESVPLFWFGAFGLLTMPFVIAWMRADAARAYETAIRLHFIGLEGEPALVVSIADDSPKRWWVLLHIRLHPEVIGADDR